MQVTVALLRVTWAFLVGAGVVMVFTGTLTGMWAVAYIALVLAVAIAEFILKDRQQVPDREKIRQS